MRSLALSFCALLLAGACATEKSGGGRSDDSKPRPMLAGGYSKVTSGPGVDEARDVAVNELYKRFPQRAIVEKVTVEQQVVAGMNYRFHFTMSGGAKYEAVIFRDVGGRFSVTSLNAVK